MDSGPFIALFDKSDKYHKDFLKFFVNHKYCFISTIAVFAEVSHMLDFCVKAQQDFFNWVTHKGVLVSDINQNDMPRIAELMAKYADLPMDFADATLVVAAEKSGIREIVSIDSDFDIYRLFDRSKIINKYKR